MPIFNKYLFLFLLLRISQKIRRRRTMLCSALAKLCLAICRMHTVSKLKSIFRQIENERERERERSGSFKVANTFTAWEKRASKKEGNKISARNHRLLLNILKLLRPESQSVSQSRAIYCFLLFSIGREAEDWFGRGVFVGWLDRRDHHPLLPGFLCSNFHWNFLRQLVSRPASQPAIIYAQRWNNKIVNTNKNSDEMIL